MFLKGFVSAVYLFLVITLSKALDDVDPNGYLLYCPCMGKKCLFLISSLLARVLSIVKSESNYKSLFSCCQDVGR